MEKVLILVLLELVSQLEGITLTPFLCHSWCLAKCDAQRVQTDEKCWSKCLDLGDATGPTVLSPPVNVYVTYPEPENPLLVRVTWDLVSSATFYALIYDTMTTTVEMTSTTATVSLNKPDLCRPTWVKVAAISADGVSEYTEQNVPFPKPYYDLDGTKAGVPKLKLEPVKIRSGPNMSVIADYQLPLAKGWSSGSIRNISLGMIPFLSSNGVVNQLHQRHFNPNTSVLSIVITSVTMNETDVQLYFQVDTLKTICNSEVKYSDRLGELHPTNLSIDCEYLKEHPLRPLPKRCYNLCKAEDYSIVVSDKVNCTETTAVVTVNAPKFTTPRGCKLNLLGLRYGLVKPKNASKPSSHVLSDYSMTGIKNLMLENSDHVVQLEVDSSETYGFMIKAYFTDTFSTNKSDLIFDKSHNLRVIDMKWMCAAEEDDNNRTRKVIPTAWIVGIVIIVAILLAIGIALACVWSRRSRKASALEAALQMQGFDQLQYNGYQAFPKKPDVQDKWEIDRQRLLVFDKSILGQGAFGRVVKGQVLGTAVTHVKNQSQLASYQECATNPIVAVKQCHEFADDSTKKDFLQEISLMKKLYYHPALVNIVHCVSRSEPYSLIVEFCPGGDLMHFLRSRRKYMLDLQNRGIDYSDPNLDHKEHQVDQSMLLGLQDFISMCHQVADGMEYISQKGFVHRDLAARNVLVTTGTSVKIGDFGLCRFVYGSTAYMAKGGKLPIKWMALEAIERYEFTTKADIWSFGVLMFEIVTLGGAPYANVMPLDGDFRKAMLEHLWAGHRMEQPPNCPQDYYEIMRHCWNAEPDDRPEFSVVKERLRLMLEAYAELDFCGNYGFYLDPTRSYYNATHMDDETTEGNGGMDLGHDLDFENPGTRGDQQHVEFSAKKSGIEEELEERSQKLEWARAGSMSSGHSNHSADSSNSNDFNLDNQINALNEVGSGAKFPANLTEHKSVSRHSSSNSSDKEQCRSEIPAKTELPRTTNEDSTIEIETSARDFFDFNNITDCSSPQLTSEISLKTPENSANPVKDEIAVNLSLNLARTGKHSNFVDESTGEVLPPIPSRTFSPKPLPEPIKIQKINPL